MAIDLHRAKSVRDIFTDAVRSYARYPLLFAALALGVVAPYTLIVLAVNRSARSALNTEALRRC